MFHFLLLLPVAHLVSATPVQLEARETWYPSLTRCSTCFLSSWTQGPECTTDAQLQSSIRRIKTPPAEATATFTPTKWCSDYLRRTDLSTARTTSTGVSTYTTWTIEHLFVTTTDFDHPTSTMYCPIPSSGMECGWDSNTVAPWDQGQDWSVEKGYNAEECQQICLSKPGCKAYRLQDGKSNCEIFNVGLGKGAKNVVNPTPSGSQWWDRNCQKHAPVGVSAVPEDSGLSADVIQTPCAAKAGENAPPAPTAPAAALRAVRKAAAPAQPVVRSIPTPFPGAEAAAVQKRGVDELPLPKHLDDLNYYWDYIFVEPACSCIVSSVLPPTSATSTTTLTSWKSTVTVSATFEDWFTVTETPRETTIYKSVN
ncbi:hypothetical protein M011DRAFT_291215 [Sporormia fimetaria CBS 119925]|uniref:Apple domain-containing protein n=1 Tax=Sporormia fimetaria CBS 119925 TaxID=1340428 RepID=A0A6A6UVR4_9PLEO|nr:hypothetical protein M011DRAFT_291215 [Sporormia fimetaria CBS 119925]